MGMRKRHRQRHYSMDRRVRSKHNPQQELSHTPPTTSLLLLKLDHSLQRKYFLVFPLMSSRLSLIDESSPIIIIIIYFYFSLSFPLIFPLLFTYLFSFLPFLFNT